MQHLQQTSLLPQCPVGLSCFLTAMDQTFPCILLLLSLYATFGKYVYIMNRKTWPEAQKYCQEFHTDLAPVNNEQDTAELRQLAGNTSGYIWIGMKRSSTNKDKWMWSGGGEISTFFWAQGQPDNHQGKDVGSIHNYLWNDAYANQSLPFFCYSAVVVRKTMTWEEASQYCRENHNNLASVASETEMLLIQKELDKAVTTEQVWMGLRFLPESWLWVDGKLLNYTAWGQGGKPACPDVKLKCGALHTMQETQSSNANSLLVQVGAVTVKHILVDTGLTASEGSNADVGTKQTVWEAHDCEERLNFVCY